jgi:putative membrane protein
VSDDVASRPGDPPIADVFSWIRTDLSNLRTLMSWARTAVSLIGFGFTIFNFFSGFLDDSGEPRLRDFSRNLGIALVVTGTLAVLVGVYNYWMINQYLERSSVAATVHRGLKLCGIYSYVISAVLALIGVVTILFMFRVI